MTASSKNKRQNTNHKKGVPRKINTKKGNNNPIASIVKKKSTWIIAIAIIILTFLAFAIPVSEETGFTDTLTWNTTDNSCFRKAVEMKNGNIATIASVGEYTYCRKRQDTGKFYITVYDRNSHNIIWQKHDENHQLNDIIPTSDGGIIVVGEADLDALTSKDYAKAYMVKYDKQGAKLWDKEYLGDGVEGSSIAGASLFGQTSTYNPGASAAFYDVIETRDKYIASGDAFFKEGSKFQRRGIIVEFQKDGTDSGNAHKVNSGFRNMPIYAIVATSNGSFYAAEHVGSGAYPWSTPLIVMYDATFREKWNKEISEDDKEWWSAANNIILSSEGKPIYITENTLYFLDLEGEVEKQISLDVNSTLANHKEAHSDIAEIAKGYFVYFNGESQVVGIDGSGNRKWVSQAHPESKYMAISSANGGSYIIAGADENMHATIYFGGYKKNIFGLKSLF